MRSPLPFLGLSLLVLSGAFVASCSDDAPASAPDDGAHLAPGEVCDATNTGALQLHFDPPEVVVAPGELRPVRLVMDPDTCAPLKATLASADGSIASAPAGATFDLRHATFDFSVTGGAAGKTDVVARMHRDYDGTDAEAHLPVEVRDPALPTCDVGAAPQTGALDATHPSFAGSGALSDASVGFPPAAFTRTDELAIPAFTASIACAGDLASRVAAATKPRALGPAVAVGASDPIASGRSLRREMDVEIPINPSAMPAAARLRHVQVLFARPGPASVPRAVTIANPRIVRSTRGGNGWVLHFSTPWFGTYQAAVDLDAGTHRRTRHLTHRAVVGVSMGGGGAATLGVRHHDRFDVVAPLGGTPDWTWLLWYVETYATGGFCPVGSTCPAVEPNRYPLDEPIAHTMDWDHWWYQDGAGNGGRFPRYEFVQLITDLSVMRGNPNGQNVDPALTMFAPGPTPSDPWVKGDTTGLPPNADCRFAVEPIRDDPDKANQELISSRCYATRCDPKNAFVAPTGYYDDEYNPDGTRQVISFCDGNQTGESPYMNTWAPPSPDHAIPVNFALAVDLNKNGVRDMGEPVIRSGHEAFDDTGVDAAFDANEPGYDAVTNPDPAGDDYDAQINPSGTEGNHRRDDGEPFRDFGLDGVPSTQSKQIGGDPGESDGKYTQTKGADDWYAIDPHSIVHRWPGSTDVPGGPLDDDAFARVDFLCDGGVRDLFNLGVVTKHFMGAVSSRLRADGRPIHRTAFYNGFDLLPGEVPGRPQDFAPANIRWADLADAPMVRYGDVDATPEMIKQGDGMHVGTGLQILSRIEMAFYFAASRWPDADRTLSELTRINPESETTNELGAQCEIEGRCEKIFTGPRTGRTGPIAVTLPPGYALAENRARDVRYPVVFVLHGYGQDPRDLESTALITNNFMNDNNHSYATRLPKFIVVYVDGRCRVGKDGKPECVQGTFYLNSSRPDGAQLDTWFDEVIDYVDANYRTMKPSDVEVVE